MSDKHDTREPGSSGTELDEDELGGVFGGRILRIASFYLRNRVEREDQTSQYGQPTEKCTT